ncbi:hypothetical protein [Alteromonas sp. AMM-1]|uniref:hypothetical protein n=1 Tax=Alteromonas sp. AMM-1 TaxID=3394233 RepID=UPI0039A50C20
MVVFLALIFEVIGCLFLYGSNKNQRLFAAQLTLTLRYAGYILNLAALVCWLNTVSIAAAICIWTLSIMVVLGALPFFSLIHPAREA